LVLEHLGGRGDDHTAVALVCVLQSREGVGVGLADTRRCLEDAEAFLLDDQFDVGS